MKMALLVCDHVAQAFAGEHGTYPDMFRRFLPDLAFHTWFVCDGVFPAISDYDAFVCTGSKFSVYDDLPWVRLLKSFTAEAFQAKKKFVGVCFGHQLIAEALGGKVEKAAAGYQIGLHQFTVRETAGWMKPEAHSYKLLMLCQDQVIKLPPDSRVLASSPGCPMGMFTTGDHFLAIQGHPEFTKAYNRAVFESRRSKMGEEKLAEAIESLAGEPDRELLSGWITRFLKA